MNHCSHSSHNLVERIERLDTLSDFEHAQGVAGTPARNRQTRDGEFATWNAVYSVCMKASNSASSSGNPASSEANRECAPRLPEITPSVNNETRHSNARHTVTPAHENPESERDDATGEPHPVGEQDNRRRQSERI